MDVDAVDPGQDFQEAITQAVLSSGVLLAVIGPRWIAGLRSHESEGNEDFVRFEIESALSNGIATLPILVEGGRMPKVSDLPAEIQPLARRNAIRLSSERWRRDIQDVISAVKTANDAGASTETDSTPSFDTGSTAPLPIDTRGQRVGKTWKWVAAGIAVVLLLSTVAIYSARKKVDQPDFSVLLTSHMPSSLQQTCMDVPPDSADVIVRVDCSQTPLKPTYQLFSDRAALRDAFVAITAPLPATGETPHCEAGQPSSGIYGSQGGSGQLACFRGQTDGLAHIAWTIDDLNVLGTASADSSAVGIERVFLWFESQEGVWELRE